MMLTEVLLGIVPTQKHYTMCDCPRTTAGARTAAEVAVFSTPGAAAGSPNASNIGPAAMQLWPSTLLQTVMPKVASS